MLKEFHRQFSVIKRAPSWVLPLGAALMLIAAGLGAGVITGQATAEIKQAITVGFAQSLTPTGNTVTTTTTAAADSTATTIKVVSTSGFAVNQTLVIDQGTDVEFRQITDLAGFATGTLTFAATVAANETSTIGTTGYTYRATLTSPAVAFEVLIGDSFAASRDNLIAAINAAEGAGTTYSSGTTAHPTVSAAKGSGSAVTLVVTAKTSGTAGNSIATTETLLGTNNAWTATTLTGGTGIIGTEHKLVLDAPLTGKHGLGVTVAATTFSATPGIVTENKTRFLSSLSINQGETGRIQWALENNSNQKAVARLEVTGLPSGALLTASSLDPIKVTAVIRQGPTTFLVEIAENKVGDTANVELDIIAADTTSPGFYPVDVKIEQIPN